jgi:hypothetical protein
MGGGGGGCFSAETPILMANNRVKEIQNVTVGMYVMSFNQNTSQLCPAQVTGVMEPREDIQLYDVVLSNGKTLEISGGHPINTADGWKYTNQAGWETEVADGIVPDDLDTAGELEVGDEVFTIFERGVTVESVTPKAELQTTHNLFGIEHTETYFASGVLVHNMGKK